MKKIILSALAFFACGQIMAMDQIVAPLKNEIEKRAQAWGLQYVSDVTDERLVMHLGGGVEIDGRLVVYDSRSRQIPVEEIVGRIEEEKQLWIQACTAYALKQIKQGKPLTTILALPTKSQKDMTWNIYNNVERERCLEILKECRIARYDRQKLAQTIEADWQEIRESLSEGRFALIKK